MARIKDGKELFGRLVTLIGGTGFFGEHITQELLVARRAAPDRQPCIRRRRSG